MNRPVPAGRRGARIRRRSSRSAHADAGSAPGLGTRLRHLLELLDGDVEALYRVAGLRGYRPRYTPVLRALEALGPASIKAIAAHAGISHSAASQTVAQMRRAGLVEMSIGRDARERVVEASAMTARMLPRLKAQWAATTVAAQALDAELAHALSDSVAEAISALEQRPFRERIGAQLAKRKSTARQRRVRPR